MNKGRALLGIVACVAGCLAALPAWSSSRIKDITTVQGIRDNQLVGYGLVIGLAGTGDSLRNAPFTEQSMRSMLQRMGVGVEPGAARTRNVAAVAVTATLPPFVAQGARIDVNVASLGDSTSLSGGTLIMTPLVAADGNAYAVAQGQVTVSGFSAQGQAASVTQGVPTAGRIANGAIVERDHSANINDVDTFTLQLQNPDFRTAAVIADAINIFAKRQYGAAIASEQDFRSVRIARPKKITASRLFAEIGELPVDADTPARIVVDEKSGTIVIGHSVRVLPVAISHGNLVVKVTEQPIVSQPKPLSNGETTVVPDTSIDAQQTGGPFALLQGPTLERLVAGLNKMGLKPTDIISILQSLKTAGALQAELVIQ